MTQTTSRRVITSAFAVVVATLFFSAPAFAKRTVAQKKQVARTQFETAERLREALNGKPKAARTKRDYTRVMDAYRKVYYTAPTSSKADASAIALGELMVEYGRAFDDQKSFQDSIGQFEFLRREYPGSRYRMQALLSIAEVYRENLDDQEKAHAAFEEFLKKYPDHELADDARNALEEMDAQAKAEKLGRNSKKLTKKEKAILARLDAAKKEGVRAEKKRAEAEDSDEEETTTPASVANAKSSGQKKTEKKPTGDSD